MPSLSSAVTLDSRVARSSDVLVQILDGEAVLLDLASESYFGLNTVGTRIWSLLGELPDLRAIHARLCAEFDADPERIANDLQLLVGRLAETGLVKVE